MISCTDRHRWQRYSPRSLIRPHERSIDTHDFHIVRIFHRTRNSVGDLHVTIRVIYFTNNISSAQAVWLRAACVCVPTTYSTHTQRKEGKKPDRTACLPCAEYYTCIIMDRSKTAVAAATFFIFIIALVCAERAASAESSFAPSMESQDSANEYDFYTHIFCERLFRSPHGRRRRRHRRRVRHHTVRRGRSACCAASTRWANQPSGQTLYLNSTRVILMSLL